MTTPQMAEMTPGVVEMTGKVMTGERDVLAVMDQCVRISDRHYAIATLDDDDVM